MYPKNNASPPVYDVGALIQISDGAVQTSGESVRVKIGTGAWGAGAGTAACDATSGIYTYAPSQAETNTESFVVAIYKTGCIPISRTVVTSASGTSGYAGLDWGVMANKTTTNALTGTTIATTQKVDVDTIKTQTLTAAAGITFGVYVGGTAAAAVASTALSTATWTGTLATNIGTTNSTVATNLDAAISSRMATYTQPTGFLAATFPLTVASTTNITSASGVAISGTTTTLDALQTALNSAHGSGSWATATGFSTLDAAGVRTALGMAAADLDTQLDAILAASPGGGVWRVSI